MFLFVLFNNNIIFNNVHPIISTVITRSVYLFYYSIITVISIVQ